MQPFLRGPFGCFDARRRNLAAQPLPGLFFNSSKCPRTRLRSISRKSGFVNPLIHWNSRRERGVFTKQVLLQVGDELLSSDALESEVIEVAAQETIKLRASESLFEVTQKERALFIRDVRRAFIRIAALEIDVQDLVRVGER